jgi:hypothetical protein
MFQRFCFYHSGIYTENAISEDRFVRGDSSFKNRDEGNNFS